MRCGGGGAANHSAASQVRTVLLVSHDHPAHRIGGVQVSVVELAEELRKQGRYVATIASRGDPDWTGWPGEPASRISQMGDDAGTYLFSTEKDEFDRVRWTARRKGMYTREWRRLLRAVNPDVVHFRHTLWLGYDTVTETRHALPHVPIVYTLSDFNPICLHGGQMVRTRTLELCERASPQRCHGCFPQVSPTGFLLRERFVKAALEHVDVFISPSEHLRRRFIAWGLAADRIVREDTGRRLLPPLADPSDAGRRRRLGFFGAVTRFKGLDLLLEAVARLDAEGVEAELRIHASGLDENPSTEFDRRLRETLAAAPPSVRAFGRYGQGELPRLMNEVDWVVVPSLWWENAPLVIYEAMAHRRPVICADIGGMAERVRDGENGLHFRVHDARSLADTIHRAIESPDLWDSLRARLTPPHSLEDHADALTELYDRLLARRAPLLA